jgi:riboflavin-specific deaminase-like protein
MEWPDFQPHEVDPKRPYRPTRLDLAYAAEGMVAPTVARPPGMRSHNAHEAVEYAKAAGSAGTFVELLYEAFWSQGRNIDDVDTLAELATGLIADVPGMIAAVRERRFREQIVGFDDPAYEQGVFYVPTYWIAGERYAEQPASVLRAALAACAQPKQAFYVSLDLPTPPAGRPYVLMNMVATIDGKTAGGESAESVLNLGSKQDHEAMHRLERQVDAVMVGAGTLRASPASWEPRSPGRVVVTRSGDIPWNAAFLSAKAQRKFVVRPVHSGFAVPLGLTAIDAGSGAADLREALRELRKAGVQTLLVEGGSELNAELLRLDLADELFLTVAPKVTLGRANPTYAGGEPLPKEKTRRFELVEEHTVGDEVFLRYRRK